MFLLSRIAGCFFSPWTRRGIKFDLLKFRARFRGNRKQARPLYPRMHLGSGSIYIPAWVNVDVAGADVNVDLVSRPLPFPDNSFDVAVSQHLIEHLDMEGDAVYVMREVFRVLKPSGELWISTPDMAKICSHYLRDGAHDLFAYVQGRDPLSMPKDVPERFVVNTLFFQRGYHRNLFDFELLSWLLEQAGFTDVRRVTEADLLKRFPSFPPRNDEMEVLSVCGTKAR